MTTALVTFATVWEPNYTAVRRRHQNYWPQTSVAGHQFLPFMSDSLVSSSFGGVERVGLQMPISSEAIDLLAIGGPAGWLVALELKEFTPVAGGGVPAVFLTVAEFVGEIIGGAYDSSSVELLIGSVLSGTGAQAPPRKFTTALVGTPSKR
jgi:hypothetical protein